MRSIVVWGWAVLAPGGTPALAQVVGAAALQAGSTVPLGPSGSVRAGLSGTITFVTGRLAVGPEAGWYFTGGREWSPARRPENVVTAGGVARYDLGGPSRWIPFAIAAANLQFWESSRGAYPTENALALSGGLGLRQGHRSPLGFLGEARIHGSVIDGQDRSRTFLTLTAGLEWRW